MPASTLLRRPAVLLALGLCAIAAVTTLLGRLTNGPAVETKPVTLPDTVGLVAYPAFSPDGNRLVYSQRGASKDDAFRLFIRRVPSGAAQPLLQNAPQGAAYDIGAAWSPDGASIAFMRVENGRAVCFVVPANGGSERKIADLPVADFTQSQPRLAWTHDGKSLAVTHGGGENQPAAIALVDIANGTLRPITKPPDGAEGDWFPAISPDGSTLAFARRGSADGADLYVCDLSGENLRRITFSDRAIHGLAWMPNGSEIVYAASISRGSTLWRVAVNGGSPRDLFLSSDSAAYPAVSLSHNRLAYTETPTVSSVWRAALDSKSPGQPILRSAGREYAPSYSPDGKRIADISDQAGSSEIWVSDSDGGNRAQITSLKGPQPGRPQWSPDGKWLLFDVRRDGGGEVDKTLAEPGSKPVRLLNGGSAASWSHDGKSIYFQQRGSIWKASADGGNPEQLTERPGDNGPMESLDGKFVYYRSRRGIWRVPSAGGAEEMAAEADFIGGPLQPAKNGVYYQEFDRGDRAMLVSFFDYATKKSSVVFRARMTDFSSPLSFAASPDGKYVLYPMVDQSQTSLKFVENFK